MILNFSLSPEAAGAVVTIGEAAEAVEESSMMLITPYNRQLSTILLLVLEVLQGIVALILFGT
jgi:hypothetical protein